MKLNFIFFFSKNANWVSIFHRVRSFTQPSQLYVLGRHDSLESASLSLDKKKINENKIEFFSCESSAMQQWNESDLWIN